MRLINCATACAGVRAHKHKVDRTDARAIWEAAHRPEMNWVAVKSEQSQAVLALHRMREQVKRMRKMQINQLKALLYEFGVVVPALSKVTLEQIEDGVQVGQVPQLLQASLREQIERIGHLKRAEFELKRRIERTTKATNWRCDCNR